MKRFVVLGAVIVTGLTAIAVVGQQPPAAGTAAPAAGPLSEPVNSIEKLADNLYRIPGGGGNSAVFVRADGVVLVDTKVPNNGQALLDLIRSVTDKPVTHIINTHTHGDHVGSNAYFPASVEIVVQENTRINMEKMANFQAPESKVGLPDRTYKDRLSLFRGKEAIDLYHFGRAHTNGDTFVVFRNARVMHAGDAFAGKSLPLIDVNNGGSGVAYGETLGKAARGIRGVERVITGHSSVMSWREFVEFGDFNRTFLEHVRGQIKAAGTPEQALASFAIPERFEGYTVGGGGPFGRMAGVQSIYNELKTP